MVMSGAKIYDSRMLPEVVIYPFDKVPPSIIQRVKTSVHDRFKVRVTVGKTLTVPVAAYSPERKQYRATFLLNVLAIVDPGNKKARLGIATVDLYVPELNFVFGEALKDDRAAIFSTARLNPTAYGQLPDDALFEQRAITEAVHELGHAFGLEHCSRRDCVMWFSNTLEETDRKGTSLCSRCASRLGLSSGLVF